MQFGLYGESNLSKNKIYSFGGLNRTRNGNRNEFVDMYNMTAGEYPCMAPCGCRTEIARANSNINAVISPDISCQSVQGITGVCDGGFYYNGKLKSSKIHLNPEWKWQIVEKGNVYIINGYDPVNKKSLMYYYNIDTDVFAEGGKVMRNLIVTCGDDYIQTVFNSAKGVDDYSCTTPDGTNISNSDFFEEYKDYIGTDIKGYQTMSSEENIFQQYFKVGDEITIENFPGINNGGQVWELSSSEIKPQSNVTTERNNTIDTDDMPTTDDLKNTDIIRAVITRFAIHSDYDARYAHEVYFKLYNKNGEEVSFKNMKTSNFYCSGVTLKKRTRVFDNIAVHQGRLWGTIPSGNQIYASSSDDIFSFSSDDILNKFGARIPSDTGGSFTSICSYNNDLVCFKNDSITVVSGTNPVNYNTNTINGIGCISPKSAVVTPSGIIFLSYNGFYLYNGSVPQMISAKLNTGYVSAVSGYDGISYYASALKDNGVRELLVYNMRYGLWHKHDDFSAVDFFRFKNEYFAADKLVLHKMNSATPNEWWAEFVCMHDNKFDNKGINEIWIRAEIADGAKLWLETSTSGNEFVKHEVISKSGLHIFRCPIRLIMDTDYKIKICGQGDVVIYEIEVRKPEGGRRYKEH